MAVKKTRDYLNRDKARHLLDLVAVTGETTFRMRGAEARTGHTSGAWRKFIERLKGAGHLDYALLSPNGTYHLVITASGFSYLRKVAAPPSAARRPLVAWEPDAKVEKVAEPVVDPLARALYCRKCGVLILDKRWARASECQKWQSQGGNGFHSWATISGKEAASCGHDDAEVERGERAIARLESIGVKRSSI